MLPAAPRARPATWAKRRVQTSHPRELLEPVRGAKGRLAIQTGAERREFVVKQRVVDPVQPISVEENLGRSARVGCCRLDHCHCTVCSTRPAHRIAQDIAQHGGQALHLELELKG